MEKRITEITTGMKTFTKELYHKSEVLSELLELQNELVTLTFNEDHAEKGNLRIWDVENHFEKMNANCGNVADEQLEKFKADCKIICNTIKAEMSGQAGEYKAFRSLETLRCNNAIIKNVEFVLGDHRTELDAIVITEKGIFIIEVKNPAKDIYIDERGNYCRVSDTLIFDKNIAEKMNDKEYLLREAIKKAGIENINIINMVVFTNSSMHVENKYPYINTCYLSDLPHKIGGYIGEKIYTDADIDAMVTAIEETKCHEAYPMPIDMQAFKLEFATLMATLEKATECTVEADEEEFVDNLPAENVKGYQKALDWMIKHKKTSRIFASVALVAMASIAAVSAVNKKNYSI